MKFTFLPLGFLMIGIVIGGLIGFVCAIFVISSGYYNNVEETDEDNLITEDEHSSLRLRMNNQDYALSHLPESGAEAVDVKQKREDAAYRFLQRNRKD